MYPSLTLAIALYAAILSTVVLVWDVIKWKRTGPRIKWQASPNMHLVGDPNVSRDATFVSMTATNTGDRMTTITNVGGQWYKNFWSLLKRRSGTAFMINQPNIHFPIPYKLEPGAIWQGMAIQDGDDGIDGISQDIKTTGFLYMNLYVSHRNKAYQVRVKIEPGH